MTHMPLTRRRFLAASAAALVVSVPLAGRLAAQDVSGGSRLNPFISIGGDGAVRLIAPAFEMGQGTHTALAMILCDELGADWSTVSVQAPGLDAAFIVPGVGEQATHGSFMVRNWHDPLRLAAAAAREMLVQAAAAQWKLSPVDCSVADGMVCAGDKTAAFGDLAEAAAALPVPEAPTVLGTRKRTGQPTPRLDIPAKVDGSAVFGIDIRLPGMVYAAIRQAPVFGSTVASVSALPADSDALLVEGPTATIVVADSFWTARSTLDALDITYAPPEAGPVDSATLASRRREALDSAEVARPILAGDPSARLAAIAAETPERVLTAEYETPYLAHVAMEPMACTASVTDDACEIWAPTQGLSATLAAAVKETGLPEAAITVHPLLMGGGFGRKYETDCVVQALRAAKAAGKPVQLIWTREEDVQHDFYRPAMTARMTAALSSAGGVEALVMRKSGPSILEHTIGFPLIEGSDPIAWLGFGSQTGTAPGALQQYAVDHVAGEFVFTPTPVPVGYWRSVGASENGFFIESFIDELAHAAGADPYAFRRDLLASSPRGLAVLDKATEAAGWGKPLPEGHFQGIAFTDVVGSLVAQVIEISMVDGLPVVHRVTVAVDCGGAINPDTVVAQITGGVVMGLGAALREKITIEGGKVAESNFWDYEILTLAETPRIVVHLIESGAPLGGIGEAAVPAVAPALCNAIFAATGKRLRSLPVLAALG
jgi:isoquinoline 1-oxidoreductase beta subunit